MKNDDSEPLVKDLDLPALFRTVVNEINGKCYFDIEYAADDMVLDGRSPDFFKEVVQKDGSTKLEAFNINFGGKEKERTRRMVLENGSVLHFLARSEKPELRGVKWVEIDCD